MPTVATHQANTPRRRVWTAQQKREVLKKYQELKEHGADLGAFLRKNGLFSSTVSLWKKQKGEGLLDNQMKKRGPKTKNTDEMMELKQLKAERDKLAGQLEKAHRIIEVQKKIAAIWQEEDMLLSK